MRGSLAVGVLVVSTACFNPDPVDIQETDSPTGSSSGAVTSDPATGSGTSVDPSADPTSSGPSSCEVCVASPPEGWTGPLAIGAGETAPSCASPFTAVAFEAAQDIAGADASCECSCGEPTVDCGELSMRYSTACAGVAGAESFVGVDTCHDTDPDGPTVTPFFTPIAGTESCPPVADVDIPAATMTELVLCGGGFDQESCGSGEVCVGAAPDGFEAALCVAQEGEHECPAEYPNARSAFTDVADDRRCTACNCEPDAAGFECASELALFGAGGCEGPLGSEPTDTCFDSPASFTFAEPTVTGSCAPTNTQPTGSIAGEDPITICCQ
ncbi:MAG: hypothetical protein ACE37F_17175 [Nannocystaceae bacterium]|nr:hypothetical protein [bacterium]